jgi:hypothetical protein
MKSAKKFFLMGVFIASQVALASPVLECANPATGAEFHLGEYADQPPFYTINPELAQNLNSTLPLQGSGGTIQYGQSLLYTISIGGQSLSVDNQNNGGYLLSFAGNTFYFNPGECH